MVADDSASDRVLAGAALFKQLVLRLDTNESNPCKLVLAYSFGVSSLRQLGAVLLLLVAFVVPAMACMAPDAEMTTEERACCRMMKSQCGQMMEMPASHDCCKKAPKTISEAVIKTNTIAIHPLTFAVVFVSYFDLLAPHSAIAGWVQRPEHSPPKAPPSSITILRI